jgi:parallel beta-helix repeat protein
MAVTLSLFAGAGAQFFDNNGNVLSGGKIYTYQAGTTTPLATYTTNSGSAFHTNPIILDAAGRVPSGGEIWLQLGIGYKFVLKTSTEVLIATYDNIPSSAQPPSSNDADSIMYEQGYTVTAGSFVVGKIYRIVSVGTTNFTLIGAVNNTVGTHFIATGAGTGTGTAELSQTVETKLRQTVSVKDFGAVGDGVTDDTAAIQAALTASLAVYIPTGSYKVSAQLDLQSGSVLFGDGSASEITCANGNISIIYGLSTDNCTVKNLKVNVTVAGTSAYTGAVHFETSENCSVENVEIEGVSWAGVYLEASSYCRVTGVYAHDFRGSVQDSADVCVYRASSYNVIDSNHLFGNGWHGILVQEPTIGQIPFKNVLSNNRIGAHQTYGVAVYSLTSGGVDSFTQIVGNFIEDIDGATLSGNAGAGIYIQSCGGVTVTGNSIRNCCLSTSSLTLAPGGISIINLQAGLSPCSVSGNTITNIKNYYGVVVASSQGGVSITGNAIKLDTNAATSSVGIYINASSNCAVTSNSINLPNALAATGIFVFANGINTSNTAVTGNTILGGTFAGVRFDRTSTFVNNNVAVSANMVSGGSTANICYRFAAVVGGIASGNIGIADTANTCTVTNCTQFRLTGNNFTTSGTKSFVTSGTCTESYYDKTNYSGNAVTFIQNAATGLIVEVLNNASPGASNWAVGDRVEQSVPVVGQPKGWRCTVAGVPGTWVSEGNL